MANEGIDRHNCHGNRRWFPNELADTIKKWADKEDSLYLTDFLIEIECFDPSNLSTWSKDSTKFAHALLYTKWKIARRHKDRLHSGNWNSVQFQREIGIYDTMLKQNDREEKIFDAKLKFLENVDPEEREEIGRKLDKFLTHIDVYQKLNLEKKASKKRSKDK